MCLGRGGAVSSIWRTSAGAGGRRWTPVVRKLSRGDTTPVLKEPQPEDDTALPSGSPRLKIVSCPRLCSEQVTGLLLSRGSPGRWWPGWLPGAVLCLFRHPETSGSHGLPSPRSLPQTHLLPQFPAATLLAACFPPREIRWDFSLVSLP